MYILMIIMSILCITFFVLYLQLRGDIKSLCEQLLYSNKEESTFLLFSTSSNKEMKKILLQINALKNEKQEALRLHLSNEVGIQDMITNISHDIRTPLTSIQGYIEMMHTSDDVVEQERYYQIVNNRLHDMEAMLDEFFLYTKLINSNELYPLEHQEVYPLLCHTILSYMELLQEHALCPEIVCEDESLSALLHEESFLRICMNLIMNTVRYGQNPFRIIIQQEQGQVVIRFENHCNAVTIDTDHMFDRFFQGNFARNQKGSGLGLAIVKELCIRMQASVEASYKAPLLQLILRSKN